ncbi:helix-hairpin-helix domain-containing protein [Candidatus Uhrbacteria bacterium]|nr:helix-hairpin-helix domain-containing protein [Candidatus Uhrbacteria bacterium]
MAKKPAKKKKETQSPAQALEEAFQELGKLLGGTAAFTDEDDKDGEVPAISGEARAADVARLVLRLRSVINTLGRPNRQLTKVLRQFVAQNPTGWIQAATVEKQHLCWITPDGTIKVVLVDSPTHGLPVDDLLALVGLKQALPFLKVDYTAVCKAAESDQLRNGEDVLVAVEEILARRVREPREKRVDIDSLDPADTTPLVAVIDPEIARERLEELESLGLSAATITALRKNGINAAWDLRHLSGEEIAALEGIGEKRAAEIMAAIIKRVK